MHAASVHPEPGSNSLWVVYHADQSPHNSCFALLTCLKEFTSPDMKHFVSHRSTFSVVQFSMSGMPPRFLWDSLCSLPHRSPFVKGFWKKFSTFFRIPLPNGTMCGILTYSSHICQDFFKSPKTKFIKNHFKRQNRKHAVLPEHFGRKINSTHI